MYSNFRHSMPFFFQRWKVGSFGSRVFPTWPLRTWALLHSHLPLSYLHRAEATRKQQRRCHGVPGLEILIDCTRKSTCKSCLKVKTCVTFISVHLHKETYEYVWREISQILLTKIDCKHHLKPNQNTPSAITSQIHCMHCTCTTHKTRHLSLKSAGLSLNPCPRNTEIQRCPLMAAASFQVTLQKQQCPHGKWLGTGICCKNIHLHGYLVKTFDENVNDVNNASIVFGKSLLQQKMALDSFFSAGKNGSVLIWSRASDDHDSSWICNLQIPKLMTFTDSVNNAKTGVLAWNWDWCHPFSSFFIFFWWPPKNMCDKKFTQK